MIETKSLKQPIALKISSSLFVIIWCLVASFPIAWIAIMSIKLPVDAFSSNPLTVILGPLTSTERNSLSFQDLLFCILFIIIFYKFRGQLYKFYNKYINFSHIINISFFYIFSIIVFYFLFRFFSYFTPVIDVFSIKVLGYTFEHYQTVWMERGFLNYFKNSVIVTLGVVIVSLTFGTLAGFALARSKSSIAFWILVIALIFRALPHSILVAGYLPFFMNSAEILKPIMGELAPTFFGKPFAVIAVLVAINQPFTIWLMRSFFQNIPSELDEAARIDGCSHFQAFIKIIMPIMWPGVITTGLFSFMLGYNDYLVTSLLLDAQNQTMVPAISGLFNRDTSTTDQVVAVAAAVSITAPLFLLVLFFQKQIVSGLTAGAVKG
tara:strand:- start:210 stop:1346 length:1137 start_codon:yes stop_codon:yes gene_type:complete